MIDLIKSNYKNKKVLITGVRPGEKIHELLFTSEDAKNIYEFKKYYVILPPIQIERSKFLRVTSKGKKSLINQYDSKDNPQFLKFENIKNFLNIKKKKTKIDNHAKN